MITYQHEKAEAQGYSWWNLKQLERTQTHTHVGDVLIIFPQDGGYSQIILVQGFLRVREQTLGKANKDLQNLKEGRNWHKFH
jgi:hypothetical protein